MDIIDNNLDKKSDSAKDSKILFDYNSRQLWPEEDPEVDMDYVPQPPELSDGSSNSAVDDIIDSSAEQSTANGSTDSTKQSEDINGSSDDRIVAPIKISKNKRKNSKNWSIVGQKSDKNKQNNGFTGDTSPDDYVPKRRGRRPTKPKPNNGSEVTEAVDGVKSPPKKVSIDLFDIHTNFCLKIN